jgi:hypothetical protein
MPAVSLRERFKPADQVVARPAAGQIVLVNLGTGACWELNHVGADVWNGLSSGRELQDVVVEISQRYDVALENVTADVLGLMEELTRRALVSAVPQSVP